VSPRYSSISITPALKLNSEVNYGCTICVIGIQNIVKCECTQKTCCSITMINERTKVTSEKFSVLFCSTWNLALYLKVLNENIQRCGSDNQLMLQQQNYLIQPSWKTSKIQMLITLEMQVW